MQQTCRPIGARQLRYRTMADDFAYIDRRIGIQIEILLGSRGELTGRGMG